MDSLLSEGVMIVVKVFNLVDLSLAGAGGGGGRVLFLFRLTDSPLFSFLEEPVLVVIFHFGLLFLPRLFSSLVVSLSCRGRPGEERWRHRVSLS